MREKYGQAARRVLDMQGLDVPGSAGSCCAPASDPVTSGPVHSGCGGAAFDGTVDPITSNLSFLATAGVDVDRAAREVAGRVGAAFVRARKPTAPAA